MKKKKNPKSKDIQIDQILLNTRCVFIYGVIDSKMSIQVTKELLALSAINDDPIYIRINSPGGCATDGMSIIDTMKIIPCPIVTVICGEACSMGAIISVVGDIRMITKNSIWMCHPISVGGGRDYIDYKRDRTKLWDILENSGDEILKKYTKLSPKDLVKMKSGELWLTSEECIKKGIADEIV